MKKLNKKGATYIDLLIALFVLMTVAVLMGQFQRIFRDHYVNDKQEIIVLEQVMVEMEDAYARADWSLPVAKTITTQYGDMSVSLGGYSLSTFETEKLSIGLTLNQLKRTFIIERSVYWNE